jgi:hypothetical protein
MNDIAKQLQAPFAPEVVGFRPQGKPGNNGKGKVVAYVDARAVAERLDEVFGPLGWSFTWEALAIDAQGVQLVKGTITVDGVSKSDIGEPPGATEPSKSAVSDALKRAAVHWGIGRYLYDLDAYYVKVREVGSSWVPADGEIERLRASLPRPAGSPATRPQNAPQQPVAQSVVAPSVDLTRKLSAINGERERLNWTRVQLAEVAESLNLPRHSVEMTEAQADALLAELNKLQPVSA